MIDNMTDLDMERRLPHQRFNNRVSAGYSHIFWDSVKIGKSTNVVTGIDTK
jgi:hypothetical protein